MKLNEITNQLLLNDMEICFWNTINLMNDWTQQPDFVIEKLIANALFAKINSTSDEEAEVFKSFIMHNYKELILVHWEAYANFKTSDQVNWLKFAYTD